VDEEEEEENAKRIISGNSEPVVLIDGTGNGT
jgi:hypothetical protein